MLFEKYLTIQYGTEKYNLYILQLIRTYIGVYSLLEPFFMFFFERIFEKKLQPNLIDILFLKDDNWYFYGTVRYRTFSLYQ